MSNNLFIILILVFLIPLISISSAQVCPLGKFGWHCKFVCYCAGGDCDSDTGYCPSGCRKNRYGPGCQLRTLSVYRYSKLAHGYLENMDRTESGKQCVQGNSTVFVKCYGLHASYFPDKKIPGAVCRNMLDKVLNRLGPKDKGPCCFTNYSEDSNFMESCDLPLQGCDPGRFGEMCEFECHCKNEEPCSHLGSCPHGCHPGWMNTTYQTKCESGRYGDGCISNCGECNSGPCNIETGECEGGCAAGWKGALCKTKCDPGRYGANCSEVCGHCLSGSCRFVTGACVGGCIPGWQGEKCQDECDPGRYGANCSEVCGHCLSGSCRFVTGACVGGCIPGWQGEKCQEACDDFTYGDNCSSKCGVCRGLTSCDNRDRTVCRGLRARVCGTALSGPKYCIILKTSDVCKSTILEAKV